jgi:hypothetical protein
MQILAKKINSLIGKFFARSLCVNLKSHGMLILFLSAPLYASIGEEEEKLARQTADLMKKITDVSLVVFLFLLFKDMLASLAENALTYIKMRVNTGTYSATGGVVIVGKEPYVIVKITFGYVILKSLNGDNAMIRMSVGSYWKGAIKYKSVENLQKDFQDKIKEKP